jgi:hypothetical protein
MLYYKFMRLWNGALQIHRTIGRYTTNSQDCKNTALQTRYDHRMLQASLRLLELLFVCPYK